jgi:hypothetical protein
MYRTAATLLILPGTPMIHENAPHHTSGHCDANALNHAMPHLWRRSVRDGKFSFLADDGLAISGSVVSPANAVGTINTPACTAARWWADRK